MSRLSTIVFGLGLCVVTLLPAYGLSIEITAEDHRHQLQSLRPALSGEDAAAREAAEKAFLISPFAARRVLQSRVKDPGLTAAEQAIYDQIGHYVIHGVDRQEIDALLKAAAAKPYETAPWRAFVDRHGAETIQLVVDLRASGEHRAAAISGLTMVLERVSATTIQRTMTNRFAGVDDAWLFSALLEVNTDQSRTAGLTLFDLWARYDRRLETFETGRKLWLRGWSREFVLARIVAAMEAGDLDPIIWANAGSRIFGARSPEEKQMELLFFTSLTEARGQPQVARTLLTIADLPTDSQLWLFVQMLEMGLYDSLKVGLAESDAPESRLLEAWCEAREPGAELQMMQWDAVVRGLETEADIRRVAMVLALYDQPQAESLWQRILDTDPAGSLADAEAHRRLGVFAEERAEFAAAADHYEAFVDGMNQNARANPREAEILEKIALLRERAQPENKDYATLLAQAQVAAVRADYPAAYTAMEAAVAMRPESLLTRLMYYDICKLANDMPRAMTIAKQMATMEPENAHEHLRLASALVECGDLERAEPMLRELMEDSPDQDGPVLAMSDVEERRHNFAASIVLVKKAMELGTPRSAGYQNLAILYGELGQWTEAEKAAEALVLAEPDSDYAQLWLYIARSRQHMPGDHVRRNREAVADYLARRGADADAWAGTLLAFCAGQLTEEELLAAAKTATADYLVPSQLCEAHFYAGQQNLTDSHLTGARRNFRAAIEQQVLPYIEHIWAEAELRKLEAPE